MARRPEPGMLESGRVNAAVVIPLVARRLLGPCQMLCLMLEYPWKCPQLKGSVPPLRKLILSFIMASMWFVKKVGVCVDKKLPYAG